MDSKIIILIYLLPLFLINKLSLASSKPDSLKIMEKSLTKVKDNYFHLNPNRIPKSRAHFQRVYNNLASEYNHVFSRRRQLSLYKGVLVLDLDNNVLIRNQKGIYLELEQTTLPKSEISKAIKATLERGMTILILSSGVHSPLTIREYFFKEFNISHGDFSRYFDMIVGSKTSYSHYNRLYLDQRYFDNNDEFYEIETNLGFKGKDLCSWLKSLMKKDQKIGPIIATDDQSHNLYNIEQELEKAFPQRIDFYKILTSPRKHSIKQQWIKIHEIIQLYESLARTKESIQREIPRRPYQKVKTKCTCNIL